MITAQFRYFYPECAHVVALRAGPNLTYARLQHFADLAHAEKHKETDGRC